MSNDSKPPAQQAFEAAAATMHPKPNDEPANMPAHVGAFTEREAFEIWYCVLYRQEFNHGTDGHNLRNLVAKLWIMLQQCEAPADGWTMPPDHKPPVVPGHIR